MKCLLIAYINMEKNIEIVEGVMEYHGFNAIEQNKCYRVFTGHFNGGPSLFADRLNAELEDIKFDIEDSVFVVYPHKLDNGQSSISNLIIKRKGNKFLRLKHKKL
jgi:hypothetical protein